MTGKSRWSRSDRKGTISRWWGGALLAAGVAMTFGAASCGGSGGNTFFFLGDGVWVADQGNAQVDEFVTPQFKNGVQDVSPRKIVTNATLLGAPTALPTFTAPQDTLFDGETNLWVVDGGDGASSYDGSQQVFEFTGKQLRGTKGTVNLQPAFFISSTDMVFPQFAVFDAAGNLWVSDSGANDGEGEIFKFTAQQLTEVAGPTTPALSLTSDDLDAPIGMVFDGDGDLWVANNGSLDDGTFGLIEFKAKTLAGLSGSQDILSDANFTSVTTGQGTPSLDGPWGLSFDGAGDLFVTNEQPNFVPSVSADAQSAAETTPSIGQGTVVEFSAAQIAAATVDAAPTPVAAIVPAGVDDSASLDDPQGIFVDRRLKTIIVANDANASLSKYNLSGIGSGGALVPNSFVSGLSTTLDEPTGLSIGAIF